MSPSDSSSKDFGQPADTYGLKSSSNSSSSDTAPSAPSTFNQKTYQPILKDISHNETPSASSPKQGVAGSPITQEDREKLPHSQTAPMPDTSSTTSGGPSQAKNPNNQLPSQKSNDSDNLPHSKKVRGTLANKDGKSVNKTMLGDPASLKSETSKTGMGKDVEEGVAEGKGKPKSKL
jgi:hypothetical protein